MKLKYLLYGFVALAAVFAAAMAALFLYYRPTIEFVEPQERRSVLDRLGVSQGAVADRGRTFSGRAGRVLIAYAGDIEGSLDPCG